jgi:hypothetical protein
MTLIPQMTPAGVTRADLADTAAPRSESRREPLRRVVTEERNVKDLKAVAEDTEIRSEELDSLHPVFSESNA